MWEGMGLLEFIRALETLFFLTIPRSGHPVLVVQGCGIWYDSVHDSIETMRMEEAICFSQNLDLGLELRTHMRDVDVKTPKNAVNMPIVPSEKEWWMHTGCVGGTFWLCFCATCFPSPWETCGTLAVALAELARLGSGYVCIHRNFFLK